MAAYGACWKWHVILYPGHGSLSQVQHSSQPRNSVSLVCIASKAWLPVTGEVCGGLAGEFSTTMLVARGERSACDPATDVAYCAKEVRFLAFSAGEGDLTRQSAQSAGLSAVSGGRCRCLVPTGQLELRDRLRHNGYEKLYLTILSYALHVLRYSTFTHRDSLYTKR